MSEGSNMPLETVEYLEINLIGIAILTVMYIYSQKRFAVEQKQKSFLRMLILNIVILAADCGVRLFREYHSEELVWIRHGFCMVYFFLQGWFCYEWTEYVCICLFPRCRIAWRERLILLLPMIINSVFVFSSPKTGWVYRLSENGIYSRGPFVLVPYLTAVLYWIFSIKTTWDEYQHPSRQRRESEYITLLIFPVFTVIGNVFQYMFFGLPITWLCSTVSLFILLSDMQKDMLTRDSMTGLYNRGQANAQLLWETDHLSSSKDFLLIAMFDLDNFKLINDRFGHLEGDRALIFAARTLKKSCRKSDYVCRFGGDEFLLIGHVKAPENAFRILRKVESTLQDANAARQFPYTITMSFGYEVFGPEDHINMDTALNEVDQKMYRAKRRKKEKGTVNP